MLVLTGEKALWERFHGSPQGGAAGSEPVVARWERALRLGARTTGQLGSDAILDGAALQDRRERTEPVWHRARTLVEAAAAVLERRGFVVLFCDADGVILSSLGGGAFADTAARVRLVEGARWSEGERGVNAIGTALAEDGPVAVVGAAHTEQINHRLVCYAAPIRDPMGRQVGLLDVTGPVEAADPLAALVVESTAAAVESALREAAWRQRSRRERQLLERVLDADAAALAVDGAGRIRAISPAARAHLHLAPGASLSSLGTSWDQLRSGAQVELPMGGTMRAEPLLEPDGRCAGLVAFVEPKRATKRPIPVAFDGVVGDDPQLVAAKERAARFAASDLPVLLLAETGTGKDLLARAIHQASRPSRPYVAINCGALPADLLESELFGYGPGAFTGAKAGGREGKIAAADGGTLFLDEVAEMPPALQAALLRVLEDGSYSRVGEVEQRRARFRLICATCRDLPALVESGAFRRDLFHRIRGAVIELPPLRARSDLPVLARALLAELAAQEGRAAKSLSPAAAEALRAHDWPGNVRELKMALRHALVLCDGDVIEREHLPRLEAPRGVTTGSRARAEAETLSAALAEARGNLTAAARILGVARTTLYRMMERHGIRAVRS